MPRAANRNNRRRDRRSKSSHGTNEGNDENDEERDEIVEIDDDKAENEEDSTIESKLNRKENRNKQNNSVSVARKRKRRKEGNDPAENTDTHEGEVKEENRRNRRRLSRRRNRGTALQQEDNDRQALRLSRRKAYLKRWRMNRKDALDVKDGGEMEEENESDVSKEKIQPKRRSRSRNQRNSVAKKNISSSKKYNVNESDNDDAKDVGEDDDIEREDGDQDEEAVGDEEDEDGQVESDGSNDQDKENDQQNEENDDDQQFGTGCLVCGQNNDEDKILLCETCDGEYHFYCLKPPLRKIPEGDWYCPVCTNIEIENSKNDSNVEAVKSSVNNLATTTTNDSVDDRRVLSKKVINEIYCEKYDDWMDELVNGLPPDYTSRFGEIVWAQGGFGYGWWPAMICDPRNTIEPIRSQIRKFLGRRHLVYFFRCGSATTSISLSNTKNAPIAVSTLGNKTIETNDSVSSAVDIVSPAPGPKNGTSGGVNSSSSIPTMSTSSSGTPFSIIPEKQTKAWIEGFSEDLFLGKAARNCGKQRYSAFQEALQVALLEIDKPNYERLDWESTQRNIEVVFGEALPLVAAAITSSPSNTQATSLLINQTERRQSLDSSPMRSTIEQDAMKKKKVNKRLLRFDDNIDDNGDRQDIRREMIAEDGSNENIFIKSKAVTCNIRHVKSGVIQRKVATRSSLDDLWRSIEEGTKTA